MKDTLLAQLDRSLATVASLRDDIDDVQAICTTLIEVLRSGGTIYTAGNGGSAAHALHLAEELIGRYRANREPLRAVCLNADPTAITCIANDFGYDEVFARPCRALICRGDALCVFSTSGNSVNLNRALTAARDLGATTIGLLGRDGGAAVAYSDFALVIPATDSAAIQDAHQVALHLICEAIERAFEPTT